MTHNDSFRLRDIHIIIMTSYFAFSLGVSKNTSIITFKMSHKDVKKTI